MIGPAPDASAVNGPVRQLASLRSREQHQPGQHGERVQREARSHHTVRGEMGLHASVYAPTWAGCFCRGWAGEVVARRSARSSIISGNSMARP